MQQNKIITEVNKDIIRAVNREISLRAKKFSDQLLSSVFRAIFRVEQALEFAEPEVFQLEHDPERIAWSRLDSYKLMNLSTAIANEEVCANRYQLFTEYDFIVLVDVSRSMMLKWWAVYGAPNVNSVSTRDELFTSKLYFLKYILLSFLYAAQKNQFNCWIKFFGRNRIVTYSSRDDAHLEESMLSHIDRHFGVLARSGESEMPMLPEALREILDHKKRCVVLCISDFMDGVCLLGRRRGNLGRAKLNLSDFVPYLAEIAYRHKMLVFRINDIIEKQLLEEEEVSADNPYYDMESEPDRQKGYINRKYSKILNRELIAWQKRLAGTLRSLGIDFETFDAGSLASVDKAIYRLGLITGA